MPNMYAHIKQVQHLLTASRSCAPSQKWCSFPICDTCCTRNACVSSFGISAKPLTWPNAAPSSVQYNKASSQSNASVSTAKWKQPFSSPFIQSDGQLFCKVGKV